MALLQIAEPGQSSAPHEHRIAIGIDLGTTHSLVATVRSGKAKVLQDEQGRVLLPSIVHYAKEQNAYGEKPNHLLPVILKTLLFQSNGLWVVLKQILNFNIRTNWLAQTMKCLHSKPMLDLKHLLKFLLIF
jgi:hypothetical protein